LKQLLSKLPKIYACVGNAPKVPHGTFFQVFVGDDTIFEPGQKVKVNEILRGTVNTLAVILPRMRFHGRSRPSLRSSMVRSSLH